MRVRKSLASCHIVQKTMCCASVCLLLLNLHICIHSLNDDRLEPWVCKKATRPYSLTRIEPDVVLYNEKVVHLARSFSLEFGDKRGLLSHRSSEITLNQVACISSSYAIEKTEWALVLAQ